MNSFSWNGVLFVLVLIFGYILAAELAFCGAFSHKGITKRGAIP